MHKEIQESLRSAVGSLSGSAVGQVYQSFARRLRVYDVYVRGYEEAAEELQRWEADSSMRELLEELRTTNTGQTDRLPLSALLIQPVQRLCRYPLLFGEVLKVFGRATAGVGAFSLSAACKNTPTANEDYADISEALVELENVTRWVNEEKRKHFQAKRLAQIAAQLEGFPVGDGDVSGLSGRQVMHEGLLKVSGGIADRTVVSKVMLFTDMVVWARVLKGGATMRYEGHVVLDHLTKSERLGSEIVRLERNRVVYLFTCKDSVEAEYWNAMLSDCIAPRRAVWEKVMRLRTLASMSEVDLLKKRVADLEAELTSLKALFVSVCTGECGVAACVEPGVCLLTLSGPRCQSTRSTGSAR